MKFRVTWPDGRAELNEVDCTTPDAYAMQTWGRETAAAVLVDHGVRIELDVVDVPASQPEPESEPAPEAPAIASESAAPAKKAKKAPSAS